MNDDVQHAMEELKDLIEEYDVVSGGVTCIECGVTMFFALDEIDDLPDRLMGHMRLCPGTTH